MNAGKLFIKTILISAIAAVPVSLSSCDYDDGSDSLAEPEVAKGEGEVELSGDKTIKIAYEGPITVQEVDGATTIRWTDTNDNQVGIDLTQIGETGTFKPANPKAVSGNNPQGSKGSMFIDLKGQEVWVSKADTGNQLVKGAINITTNNDSTIAGTVNDVKLVPEQGNGSVTVNGEFNASKSNSDPSNPIGPGLPEGEAEAKLTGDIEGTIYGYGNGHYRNVTEKEDQLPQGGDVTGIFFLEPDGDNVSISLFFIGEIGTFSANPRNEECIVEVTFDDDTWTSEDGEISISTNNDDQIAGKLNDVQLSPLNGSGSVTLNGGFNLAKD